ncbi:irregular chiasm C-roughest protein isoform X2 [Parasteatoda tepidariorum]|uniref:irregular chiasm C-roughest protein isoform X2 n=1 Tax=Parasteatoda tepidariorum TaxID=114398 RepID=UPI001C71E93F|nr:synaptogenesis protein syg-1-like isoform X2 [Parasteatoda tepidariorum]
MDCSFSLFLLFWITSAYYSKGALFLQVFDTLPEDREVNPGELIIIPCKVRNRKGECAWLKDGVVVGKIPGKYTFNREPDDGNCGITITNTQLEDDDGLWQCQVTQASLQELTLTSPEVKLTVREAPYPPIIEDTTIQIVQGDPFTARANEPKRLHCIARKGNPPASLKWFINHVEVTTNVNQTNIRDVEKRKTWQAVSALDMTFTKEDNHKLLKCVAIHDAYDTKAKDITVQLEILYPPEISLEGKPKQEIVEDMSLTLRCKADANPKANIIWRKSGHSGIYDIKDHIEFRPIRRTDSGIYSCSAKNDIGQSEEMEITVDVKFKPKINRVYPAPRTTVSLYQSTRLVCEAEGNPAPKYSWFQRIGGDAVVWSERTNNATFYIQNVTYNYQGIYLCQASNTINGQFNTVKSEEIFLDVTGPPQLMIENAPLVSHMVVDKDETAKIIIRFCSDPEPRRSYWEWDSFRQETNSNTGRHDASEIQKIPNKDDCYDARLIIRNVEGGDSKTYTLVVENDKGHETFSIVLEVREPFILTLMIGGAVVVILILICLLALLICLVRKEKCCFRRSDGFKPAPDSIVENGCPDNDKSDLTAAKTVPFCTNSNTKGKIATIGEDPYNKNGKKGAVKFVEGANGVRSKPDHVASENVRTRILDVEL